MKTKQEMEKEQRIFSGEESERMWQIIGDLDDTSTFCEVGTAIYLLACKCQELEEKLQSNSSA